MPAKSTSELKKFKIPPASPETKEEIDAFLEAMIVYCERGLRSLRRVPKKDRPAFIETQIQRYIWGKGLFRWAGALNRQRRAPDPFEAD